MNRLTFTLLAMVLILFSVGCQDEIDSAHQQMNLTHIKTIPGGCNTSDLVNKNGFIENDTVFFLIKNDTLNLFTGINYICCAPFQTSVYTTNDSILISLEDTCNESNQSCYCRCNCYYTWNFLIGNFVMGTYFLKIELNDPRQNNPVVIWESPIEIKE